MRNLASLPAAPISPPLLYYDAFMLQVHDQMMIDMVLRPLLLVLLVFFQNFLLDDTKGVVRQHDSQIPIASPSPKASGGTRLEWSATRY